jgi:uncharacterized protein (DUF1015 family)
MEIKPFKAFRFNADVVGDVGSCAAPPYDVISPDQQQQLFEKNKYNIVHIIKGKTTPNDNAQSNQYTRAADYLNSWLKEGALKQDLTEAIYAYVQDFELAGAEFQRLSFIALCKLEEFSPSGRVKPHEQIFEKPMIDRLNLKRATAARFGLVFMLYEDEQKIADKIIENVITQSSSIDFVDEQNVRHRLFAITTKEDIETIIKMMSDKSCIIADGHHRYTTGLTYSKQSNNSDAKYQMFAFTNIYQKGLVVLANHRLVSDIEDFDIDKFITALRKNFEVTEFKFDRIFQTKTEARQKMLAQMKAEHYKDNNAFGIYSGNNAFYVATLKNKHVMDTLVPNMSYAWRNLDVSVLHKLIFEKLLGIDEEKIAKDEFLEYVKDTPNAIDDSISKVDSGQRQIAFFMNPIKLEQLKMVTDAGERMPQKSTYFYPKMYSGLTIQKL